MDLQLLTPDDFINRIQCVLNDSFKNDSDLYYRFTFTKEGIFSEIPDTLLGKLLHTKEELDTIKNDYITMVSLLTIMVEKGFDITKLVLVNSRGLVGSEISYITPNDKGMIGRYVRSSNPADLITKDFLHDLKHIPNRY